MFALLLQLSNGPILGYLCVIAGFLVIAASVVFVIKGKAVLSDSGAPNAVAWGPVKLTLTSAIFLFVLGSVMVALPFWEQAAQQKQIDSQPASAFLSGVTSGPGGKDLRLLLVVKPDYDTNSNGNVVWEVPLVPGKSAYDVIYLTGDGTIIGEQPFLVANPKPGAAPQKITLPKLDLQTGASAPQPMAALNITPQLDISNAEVNKSLVVH
jgi:hypothetical protein